MTKEEFLAHSLIKDPAEARRYLGKLRFITATVWTFGFFALISDAYLANSFLALSTLIIAVLLGIYAELYISKLINLLKLPRLETFEYSIRSVYGWFGIRRYRRVKEALQLIAGIRETSPALMSKIESISHNAPSSNFLSKLSQPTLNAIFIIFIILFFLLIFWNLGFLKSA